MLSSKLLALLAAFGPVAVISSPRPPPGWEVEIITITIDTARPVHYHPPHGPGASTIASDTALGAGEPTGTLTDLSPTITSEPDECEDEGSSSLSLSNSAPYPTASGSVSAYGAGGTGLAAISSLSSSMTSSMTTLSSVPVAAKNRRQVNDSPPTTTTSATAIPAGVNPPDGYAGTAGYAGTGYPSASSTSGKPKKLKGSGCAKGPQKSIGRGSGSMTAKGASGLANAYGGATTSSSMTSSASSSSSAVVAM